MERENGLARRPRHQMRREERSDNKMLPLRNILNLVFMLGAIAGVVTRLWSPFSSPASRTPGVTVRNDAPRNPCTAGDSSGEHTTPSSPARFATEA